MARGKGMPSEFADDYKFPQSTPLSAKRTVIKCSETANEQSRLWAIKLRDIANSL